MVRFSLIKAFAWPQPSLGQAYISSVARKAGHKVHITDTTFWKEDSSGRKSTSLELEQTRICGGSAVAPEYVGRICDEVSRFGADVVGLSFTSFNADKHVQLAEALKKAMPDVRILVGGVEPMVRPEAALGHSVFDAICVGEGEESVCEYLNRLEQEDFPKVQGIWVRKGRRVHRTGVRPFVRDLDTLPFVDWEGWPLNSYQHQYLLSGALPMLASRGCPYRCTFCADSLIDKMIPGSYFRLRSPHSVVDEVQTAADRRGTSDIRAVTFLDETFGLVKCHFEELMARYREEGLHITHPWDCQTRPDVITRGWAADARKAGCVLVRMGIEHGMEAIRKQWYGRDISDEAIRQAAENLRREGILSVANLILGGPFETVDTLKRSLAFTRNLGTEFTSLSILHRLPGTEMDRLAGMQPKLSEYAPPAIIASDALNEEQLLKEFFAACKHLAREQCMLAVRRMGLRLPSIAATFVHRILATGKGITPYRNPGNLTLFRFIIEDAVRQYRFEVVQRTTVDPKLL